jgi:hypothetical protein
MTQADESAASVVPGGSGPGNTVRRSDGLLFIGEMYGVQLDLLASVLDVTQRSASDIVAKWQAGGLAESARLSPGPRWVWLTKAGLAACGLPYLANRPGLSRLAHLRAVSATRLAFAGNPRYASAGAYWRSERRLRARIGGRIGLREHVPDGELHWPHGAPVDWADECWAIEAELTPKTLSRTVAIMRELLTRTGDYGCPAADARVPGRPARHTRAIYLCSPAAQPVVARARDSLGSLGARIEIRPWPASAELSAPAGLAGEAGLPGEAGRARPVQAGRPGGRGTART